MCVINLRGLGVALVTPFRQNLSIDFDSLEKILDHVIEGGCDYIVALGTTAETPTLSREEKILLSDFIRQRVNGRVPLVIGIGGNNTARVVKNLLEGDLNGYSAVLSVAPYYNKPNQEGIFLHYKTIAEASPLPVILYNVPSRTGVNITEKTALLLAEHPNIIGIKEASGNICQIRGIIEKSPQDFYVISGDDSKTLDIVRCGGIGVISVLANALPQQMKQLVNLSLENKYDEAAKLQEHLKEITGYLFEDGSPAGVKCALSVLGLCENILRLPLVPVSFSTTNKIKEVLKG